MSQWDFIMGKYRDPNSVDEETSAFGTASNLQGVFQKKAKGAFTNRSRGPYGE